MIKRRINSKISVCTFSGDYPLGWILLRTAGVGLTALLIEPKVLSIIHS